MWEKHIFEWRGSLILSCKNIRTGRTNGKDGVRQQRLQFKEGALADINKGETKHTVAFNQEHVTYFGSWMKKPLNETFHWIREAGGICASLEATSIPQLNVSFWNSLRITQSRKDTPVSELELVTRMKSVNEAGGLILQVGGQNLSWQLTAYKMSPDQLSGRKTHTIIQHVAVIRFVSCDAVAFVSWRSCAASS